MFYGWPPISLTPVSFGSATFSKTFETLNRTAMTTRDYDVTAVSFHALRTSQITMRCFRTERASVMGYGPIVVAREAFPASELGGRQVRDTRHADERLFSP
jgi:predicted solute-binding protein